MAKSHFAGIIITREGEEGMEYLVIEYQSGEGVQIKFPGGTNNDHPGEDMLTTLKCECEEETGLIPLLDTLPEPIFSKTIGDSGKEHTKSFFMVHLSQCEGRLRTEPKVDDGDRLSPPFWRTKGELGVKVKDGGLFWSHRPALDAAAT